MARVLSRAVLTALVACLLSACGGTQIKQQYETAYVKPDRLLSDYYHKALNADPITISGQLMPETVTGSQYGPLYYDTGNGAGLAGGILAHAIINSAAQKNKNKKRVAEANAVLDSYNGVIAGVSNNDLYEAAVSEESGLALQNVPEGPEPANGWLMETQPSFILSSSQDAIYIETTIKIFDAYSVATDASHPHSYEKMIKMVTPPLKEASAKDAWLKENGDYFKDSVTNLYVKSLKTAMMDFQGIFAGQDLTMATIRYIENGQKKVERGKMIKENCDQYLFETLHGELKVVSRIDNPDLATCSESPLI